MQKSCSFEDDDAEVVEVIDRRPRIATAVDELDAALYEKRVVGSCSCVLCCFYLLTLGAEIVHINGD